MKTETIKGREIRVYDNGGKTFDRYTVAYMDETNGVFVQMLGMSENPFHPQGFGQHCEGTPGRHLGRRISFNELPEDCQKATI